MDSTFGEIDPMSAEDNELEDGDLDEVDFPDSEDEGEDEDTALLRAEVSLSSDPARLGASTCRICMMRLVDRSTRDGR